MQDRVSGLGHVTVDVMARHSQIGTSPEGLRLGDQAEPMLMFNVRFWLLADIRLPLSDVRFTPSSRLQATALDFC